MRMPFAIIAGKSMEEVVEETLQESELSKKVDMMCSGRNMDRSLKNRYTYLPLKETLFKDFSSEDGTTKKDRVLVKVSECGEHFPDSIISNDWGDKSYRQEQIIIGEKIFLDREANFYRDRSHQWSNIRGCYANLYANENFRRTFEALGEAFIKNTFDDPRKVRSWWFKEDSERNHVYDIRLIVPSETVLYPEQGLYEGFIQPKLKALGYEVFKSKCLLNPLQ